MNLKKIIPFAHQLLEEAIEDEDITLDATCGNGHDTLLLSRLVGDHGRVYAFDIQKQAIETTKEKLDEAGINNVELIHDSHEKIDAYVKEDEIGGAIFNLGYLPRSDKSIVTKPDSTLAAIKQILPRLKKNGILILVIYTGHPGGQEERDAVVHYAQTLEQESFSVLKYEFMNMKNSPPFVLAIEKR